MKSPKGTSASTTAKKAAAPSSGAVGNQDAIALLKQDHRNVEALFKTYQTADQREKQEIVQRICNELIVHTMLEEEIFYQACRDKGVEAKELDEAQIEHDSAKLLIGELLAGSPGSQYFDAKVTVLSEYIKHHVGEEEKPSEGIFAKAKKQGLDMSALGQRLQARKQELMEKAEANELGLPSPRALQLQSNQEYQEARIMPRYSNDRDRDERGRFTSDEDDDRRYSRSRSSSRYEDDDDRRGRGRGGWFGDSEGHSEAARSRRGSSRYDDDDDRGGGRGRGGWFGDPEGHAEAARERGEDDDRGGRSGRSRSSSRYDEDDDNRGGRSSQSLSSGRYDEDDDRGGRSARPRASSRDDDDRGGRGQSRGGWFGDPQGRAEAARQRWEDDDRGGRSSRSRAGGRYDEDERSGRSRSGSSGQSSGQGWYGDSEGHARAARRGWRDRD